MKHKIKEWVKRYLPAEVFATIGALIGSFLTLFLTQNTIVSAYGGTVGENIGYYGYISIRDFLNQKKKYKQSNQKYNFVSFLKLLRNLVAEFGFSEFLDSFIVRPFCMWVFPIAIGNFALGIIVGKIIADLIFYLPTIIAYELKKKHLDE